VCFGFRRERLSARQDCENPKIQMPYACTRKMMCSSLGSQYMTADTCLLLSAATGSMLPSSASTRIRHNPAEAAVPSSKFWPDDFIPCGGESYQPSRPRLGVSILRENVSA